ncbi:hypothetical protein [Mycolicibacterium thermoresistibile]|jgi:hypothetical protein|nr:hypothetical protein [Mycolicibacterium thermoresistibile]
MPVEETMWNLPVTRDQERRGLEPLRAVLAEMIARRLPPGKRLRRVVTWCADGGGLFRPRAYTRMYAVAYEVEFAL